MLTDYVLVIVILLGVVALALIGTIVCFIALSTIESREEPREIERRRWEDDRR